MNKNTILITGASGEIGGALAKYFLENQWDVAAVVRNVHSLKPQTQENLSGAMLIESDVSDPMGAHRAIHIVKEKGIVPQIVFQAAGLFLWDDGYPNKQMMLSPEKVERFLREANYETKVNVNKALRTLFAEEIKEMSNQSIGSHASTFAPDGPERNGPYKEEHYVHAMIAVENEGAAMKKFFIESIVHHTPLINTTMSREAFPPERAPDIDWSKAIDPEVYVRELFPESFFQQAA